MSEIITEELKEIINAPDSLKVIASVSVDGELHAVYKQSLHVNEDGNLEFYEIMESSQNNKNMGNSIWFERPVVINVLSKDRRSFEIKGVVYKAYVAGAYFEEIYTKLTDKGYYDLSTVWVIKPESVQEKSFAKRAEEERKAHPHFRHLDQLLKTDATELI